MITESSKEKDFLFKWSDLNTESGATKAVEDILRVFNNVKNGEVKAIPEDFKILGAEFSKSKTENGYKYRKLALNFRDSQSVEIRVGENSKIFKVKINGKETPIINDANHKAAIAEIIGKLNKGRVAFAKRLAKRADPTPTTATPRTTTTKKKQIEQLTVKRDGLVSEISFMDGQINAMNAEPGFIAWKKLKAA